MDAGVGGVHIIAKPKDVSILDNVLGVVNMDEHVLLAKATIENYVRDRVVLGVRRGMVVRDDVPLVSDGESGNSATSWQLSDELLHTRAGAFVSLKIAGELRGCIGTIAAVQASLAEEIIHNAISASTQDPRFPPVTETELPLLEYSVDVLGAAEKIESPSQLDVKRYGVIVTKGYRRGLLLPNLEGVDTVEMQLAIAARKGGIDLSENPELERFEVVRHK